VSAVAVWVICLPLAGGTLAFLLGRRLGRALGIATALGTPVLSVWLASEVWEGGPGRYALGGWGAPLGIDLYADGLSATMLLATAAVGAAGTLYSLGYFRHPLGGEGWSEVDVFWPLWLVLWASLNALFLSADVFNLYVTLELVTLSSIGLILLAKEPVARTAAMRYLLAGFLASLAYLMGVALLYAAFDTLDIHTLGQRLTPAAVSSVAAALITLSLALKTALFPLHFWLPRAHASAPGPVSAVLSALVIKASFYLLIRLWFELFPAAVTPAAGQLVGTLAAGAIIWGSLQAIRQRRLKLLIAHSTVAQIGYLFLLIPLAAPIEGSPAVGPPPWGFDAWSGGVCHAVSHALAKAAMFMAAGTVIHALGSDRIRDMRGIAGRLPMTTFTLGLAGMTLIGLPPSGGFVAKWLLLSAALASGQWWWTLVIVAGGLLAMGYVFRVLGQAFLQPEGDDKIQPVPRVMELTSLAMALGSVLLGLRPVELLLLLGIGSPLAAGAIP
jgi:multicomponent Na+:H+ antiporter subunit D